MLLFYSENITDKIITLDKNDSGHLIRVLRKSLGNKVHITDGKGNMYTCSITNPDPKKCELEITETINSYNKRDYYLHLAVAPTKNINRYEWFLEKATELGVDEISPIICHHSERTTVKTDRLKRITLAAMKQSLKAYLPKINEAVKYEDFIHQSLQGEKFIAYIHQDITQTIEQVYTQGQDCVILIGPEGDFSYQEFHKATENGFQPISLGKSRLRTETAAIAACHLINFLNKQ